MKLQDAYVSEKGDKLGNWNAIGYKMPSTALNDCRANSAWTLDVTQNGSTGGAAVYTPKLTGGPTGDCAALTPNYCNIGGNKTNCADASSN